MWCGASRGKPPQHGPAGNVSLLLYLALTKSIVFRLWFLAREKEALARAQRLWRDRVHSLAALCAELRHSHLPRSFPVREDYSAATTGRTGRRHSRPELRVCRKPVAQRVVGSCVFIGSDTSNLWKLLKAQTRAERTSLGITLLCKHPARASRPHGCRAPTELDR